MNEKMKAEVTAKKLKELEHLIHSAQDERLTIDHFLFLADMKLTVLKRLHRHGEENRHGIF